MKLMTMNVAVVCLLIGACSSNNSSSLSGSGDENFGTLDSVARGALNQANTLGASLSSEIPETDTASYSGFVGLNTGVNDVIGEMTMSVDFANDAVTGGATNFVSASDISYAGSLDFAGGFIDRSAETSVGDPQLLADVDGVLESDGLSSTVHGQLRGTFNGPQREVMSGYLSGTVTNQFETNAMNSANSFVTGTKN